jgi:hypothetical protein
LSPITSAGRPAVGSLTRRPSYTATPAGSPGAPAFGSSTKNPAFTAAVAPVSVASVLVVSRASRSSPYDASSVPRNFFGSMVSTWTRHGPVDPLTSSGSPSQPV